MNAYLEETLRTRRVLKADGEEIPLFANTSREQCEYLQRVIRDIGARRTLEIGLAHGISAIALAEATAGSLTTIDPYQAGAWHNIGLLGLERAGFTARHLEEASQDVLPRLLTAGERFDFAYIDTTKVFDLVLVDAWFVTRLLVPGGVVVFDDCNWPGVRKVVRYIARWPHLKVHSTFGDDPSSRFRKLGHAVASVTPLAKRIFRPELLETDEDLGIAASCVAFQKLAEDERPWDWSTVP